MQEGRLFTNSCVELSIPFEYQQSGNICCSWSSLPFKHHSCALAQYLTYQPRFPNNIERPYYICSPLDFNNFVHVKVQQQGINENSILEQFRYGPVEIQKEIFETVQPGQWNSADIVLNKTIKKQVYISVSSLINQENFQKQIKIKLLTQSLQFCITIDQRTAEQENHAFQKTSFFKLYDSQPNSVGILISRQMAQFTQKLKQIQIFSHFGNYVKLCFDNRICRDIFIFNMLSQTALGFQKLKPFSVQLQQLSGHGFNIAGNLFNPRDNHHQAHNNNNNGASNNSCKQLLKVPKIQSTIRASQIVGFQFLSAAENEDEQPQTENIIEDIFNILYTPINKFQKQPQVNLPSNLVSGSNVLENSIEINQKQQGHRQTDVEAMKNKIKQQQVQHLVGEDNNSFSQTLNIKTVSATGSSLRKHKTLNFHAEGYLTSHSLKILPQNQFCATHEKKNFHSEIREIELLQKINELIRMNEKLEKENRLLREQNLNLKRPINGFQRSSDLNKMIQIKTMVEIMAKKLANMENLEAVPNRNTLFTPRHQTTIDSQNRQNDRRQHRQVKQPNINKRFWSPRAHEQLVKNIREKQIEKKYQTKPSRQVERKISGTFLPQNSINSCQQCNSKKCDNQDCKWPHRLKYLKQKDKKLEIISQQSHVLPKTTSAGNFNLVNSCSPFRNVFGST